MSPEELNRTIEFIVQSQARLAAAQEQDRQDRLNSERDRMKFEEWSKGITAQVVRLLDHQSQRMDRLDKFYQAALGKMDDFQRQALLLLNLIFDRLPPAA
jgi:hypothetical protein